ncbi:MAG: alpha/beta hydrolase [Candidatus Eremiobacteraeota bacterium]|nr:alpha/beta hydrolase [Candidatus Eremiobacteraeota bacterium]
MFEGFRLDRIATREATLRVRHGGNGPAVLLLHGHPRTHTTWEHVAPLLAAHFTVVCLDLRGYGESSKPITTDDHEPYSKRAMARDCVDVMRALGHEHFTVVGHDRGAYVAFRTAMDYPQMVTRLAVLDAVPIGEAFARCDAHFAHAWWHWFFFAQPAPRAERAILAEPDAWYRPSREHKSDEAFEDFYRAIHDPPTVHAMMEDYRAGWTIDRVLDQRDKAHGKRVECPVLVLWASRDDLESLYRDPVSVWREWASEVSGERIESGHHLAEEAPAELAARLIEFCA